MSLFSRPGRDPKTRTDELHAKEAHLHLLLREMEEVVREGAEHAAGIQRMSDRLAAIIEVANSRQSDT